MTSEIKENKHFLHAYLLSITKFHMYLENNVVAGVILENKKKQHAKGRINPPKVIRTDTRNRRPIDATKQAQNLVTKPNINQEAQVDVPERTWAERAQPWFGRTKGSPS